MDVTLSAREERSRGVRDPCRCESIKKTRHMWMSCCVLVVRQDLCHPVVVKSPGIDVLLLRNVERLCSVYECYFDTTQGNIMKSKSWDQAE
ncbi:hypothetical protein GDO81_023043 [Engystomops pustulosus]|uniref:Uncharacterized protein n=1 Tax=Engystomops pustulosus TaxID=76066 RepID=A0AAV6YR81_ENGPU|nr:hypothetical protein GDO81_023043 [Engystomops pustulosus]